MNVNACTVTAVDIEIHAGLYGRERKMMRVVLGRVFAQQRSGLIHTIFFCLGGDALPNQRGGYQHETPLNHAWLALSVILTSGTKRSTLCLYHSLSASGVWILTSICLHHVTLIWASLRCGPAGVPKWGMDKAARTECRLYKQPK